MFEHLTATNKSLLREAQEALGPQNAWSCKGKLFISTSAGGKKGKKKQIKCSNDLNKHSKQSSNQSVDVPAGRHHSKGNKSLSKRPFRREQPNFRQSYFPSTSHYCHDPDYVDYLKLRDNSFNVHWNRHDNTRPSY